MIKSFAHKGLERFFNRGTKAGIQAAHANKLALILDKLDAADCPEDMDLPALRLHKHLGRKKNEADKWSVDVSGNWRVTYIFDDGDAHIVDYCDPH